MTPLQLKMLLHYYTCAERYGKHEPEHAKPEIRDQHQGLIVWELLSPCRSNESGYQITARGSAFIEALIKTPLPICKWIIPNDPH